MHGFGSPIAKAFSVGTLGQVRSCHSAHTWPLCACLLKHCSELPHHAQVWRVSWNKCGSMLASSVDDGSMHVYKMDAKGGWEQVSFIEPAHTSDAELVTSAHS